MLKIILFIGFRFIRYNLFGEILFYIDIYKDNSQWDKPITADLKGKEEKLKN